ncbi:MAG: hypothetical protein DWP95_12945 [Proteobacteria bacterium]|nr:MAG: hypothetical protein DWP95_12945 [Pseudomonadota bacterium]
MAWITAMVSTTLTAQTTVPDESLDQANPFTITKVSYQDDDENLDKSFSGFYYLNIAAAGSTVNISADDYAYAGAGCINFDTAAGFLETNIHLPDGHRIIGVRYFYKDGDTGSSHIQFYRASSNGFFNSLLILDSTGNSGTYTSVYDALAPTHYVNNAENAYVMRFYTSTTGLDQQMCGARLYMSTP